MERLSNLHKYYVLFWTDRDGKMTVIKRRVRVIAEQFKLFGMLALLNTAA